MKKLLALLLGCVIISQSGCCRGRLRSWRPFGWRNCERKCHQNGCHTACRDGCCEDHAHVHSAPTRIPYNTVPPPNNTLPPPGDGTLPE